MKKSVKNIAVILAALSLSSAFAATVSAKDIFVGPTTKAEKAVEVCTNKKVDCRDDFWNLLNSEYAEKFGWKNKTSEDYDEESVCEFASNVQLYNYNQYKKRLARGHKLNLDKLRGAFNNVNVKKEGQGLLFQIRILEEENQKMTKRELYFKKYILFFLLNKIFENINKDYQLFL